MMGKVKLLSIFLTFLTVFTFASCDSGNGDDTSQATLDLNNTELTLNVGTPDTITATATTAGGGVDTISADSSDEAVATVAVSDLTVTVTPLATGTTTITVTSGSGIEKICTVTVTYDATLNLNKTELSVNIGDTDTITATATTSGGSIDTISADSSDEAVATVAVSDLTVTVTPLTTGTTTITVTSGSGVEKTCVVTVTSVFLIAGENDDANVYVGKYLNDGTALAWETPTISLTGYEAEIEYLHMDASKNVYLYVVFEDDADNVERYIYKYNSSGTKIDEVEVSETESGYEVEEDYFSTDTVYILSVNHSTNSVRVRNFALSDFAEGTVSSGYSFTGEFHAVTMDSSNNIYIVADSIVKYTYDNTTAALTIDTSSDFDRVEHMVVRSDGTILAGGFIEYSGTGVENFWEYRSDDNEYWVLRKPALMLYNSDGSDNWSAPLYIDAKSQEGLELLFSYFISDNSLYLPVSYNNGAWSSIYENDGSNNFTVIPESVSSTSNETVTWKILKINLSDGTLDSAFTDISYTTDGTKEKLSFAYFSSHMNSLIVLENEDLDGSVNGSIATYNSTTGTYGSELIDASGKAYWFFLDY